MSRVILQRKSDNYYLEAKGHWSGAQFGKYTTSLQNAKIFGNKTGATLWFGKPFGKDRKPIKLEDVFNVIPIEIVPIK